MNLDRTQFTGVYQNITGRIRDEGRIKQLSQKFNKSKSDIQRVKSLINDEAVYGSRVPQLFKGKNDNISTKWRNDGNKLYSKDKCVEAVDKYTKAIMAAELNGEAFSLSLANRSAAHFAMKNYEQALRDIQAALGTGVYPKSKVYKLYERAAKCHDNLKEKDKANDYLSKALLAVQDSELKDDKLNAQTDSLCKQLENLYVLKEKTEKELQEEKDGRINKYMKPDLSTNIEESWSLPVIAEDEQHPVYLAARTNMTIVKTKEQGRHAVAARDIRAGEIIIVDQPFTSITVPECYDSHCFHCQKRLECTVPCRSCRTVQFCSPECEDTCWQLYHRYECQYMDMLVGNDIGMLHLAFRMIIKEGLDNLMAFKDRLKTIEEAGVEPGVNERGVYDPQDYLACYQLEGNSDKRQAADLFKKTLIAIYFAKIFLQTELAEEFKEDPGKPFPKDKLVVIGWHLLKQVQMLPCNAHEISEMQIKRTNISESQPIEVGSAIYATLSLMNHDCDPTVVRTSYGSACVLRAIKYIPQGSPIIDNYGVLYATDRRETRRRELQDQYFFECQCRACTEDWGLYKDMRYDAAPTFLCKQCKEPMLKFAEILSCPVCQTQRNDLADYDKVRDEYVVSKGMVLEKGRKLDKHLPRLEEFLGLATRHAEQPWSEINNSQEVVKMCYSMQGNVFKLPYDWKTDTCK